uniref:Acetolactate synthase n=1 Tax=Leersia perrieri TaxID=77586 RepID=A0A0D9W492_9ORYZ
MATTTTTAASLSTAGVTTLLKPRGRSGSFLLRAPLLPAAAGLPRLRAAVVRCSTVSLATATTTTTGTPRPLSPPPSPAPAPPIRRSGADILVEALERRGVRDVFAYPGGASMEIHQSLTRSTLIRTHLLRHEQGEAFAASGYARSSPQSPARPGVCIATSGPGATNLVTALADAHLDSVPLVAITGQVPRHMIGTDAFQETPILDLTRAITKHSYLLLDAADIPRVINEAFFLATSGRPGPVLVDIPKDVTQQMSVPSWDTPMRLPGYISRLPKPPSTDLLDEVIRLVGEARRPVLYVGGGCSASSDELRRFVDLTGIPVTTTLTGIGNFPSDDPLSLRMLGMHGTVYANYAVDNADLLLALGVRFDDRVTGKVEAFASRAKIVHVDIDPAEIGKNKQPHVSICADVNLALHGLNAILQQQQQQHKNNLDFSAWRSELDKKKIEFPLSYKTFGDGQESIPPQYAIQVLDEVTNGDAIIATGVGQHQMWAAQHYTFKRPRQLLSSAGLGAMGFGLPAAAGAAVANPGVTVVDIDGDGSFTMNIQELAMIKIENLPVKAMVINNQHLGMVAQWEDRFYEANRAHTYLGDPVNDTGIYPDFVTIARGFGIPAARVTKKSEVRDAIQKMIETPGPYLLDVVVPHHEHVLPMIPSNGAFKDIIVEDW